MALVGCRAANGLCGRHLLFCQLRVVLARGRGDEDISKGALGRSNLSSPASTCIRFSPTRPGTLLLPFHTFLTLTSGRRMKVSSGSTSYCSSASHAVFSFFVAAKGAARAFLLTVREGKVEVPVAEDRTGSACGSRNGSQEYRMSNVPVLFPTLMHAYTSLYLHGHRRHLSSFLEVTYLRDKRGKEVGTL